MTISSLQNPRVKRLARLSKRQQREKEDLVFVEGILENQRALSSALFAPPTELYLCDELLKNRHLGEVSPQTELIRLSQQAYNKVCVRRDDQGVVGLYPRPKHTLGDLLEEGQPPKLALVENLEKPGNLGALLRSIDGAGFDGLILTGSESIDRYHPHAIRSSLGAIFHTKIASCTNQEAWDFLHSHQITPIAAALTADSHPYDTLDFRGATAFVLGNEAQGLSSFWLEQVETSCIIPMQGVCDSLNLSVAASILLFELNRQRRTL